MKMQTPQNLHYLQLQLWQLLGPSYTRVCVGFTFLLCFALFYKKYISRCLLNTADMQIIFP